MSETKQMFVCDISNFGTLYIAGADAERFVTTMYSGDMSACAMPGGVSQGFVLNAQGEVIDLVSVFRTGSQEFLVLTAPENTEECFEWLSAHAQIADDQGPVFPELSVQDQSEHLAIMVLYGTDIATVYSDLLAACDGKLAIIAHEFDESAYALPEPVSYLLFVPINAAPEVGEFVLADPDVFVENDEEYTKRLCDLGTWVSSLYEGAYLKPEQTGFMHLLREEDNFVGARALEK